MIQERASRMLRRDHYAGLLLMAIGAIAVWQGLTAHIGTLLRMGPGSFPVMLGTVLLVLGVLVALMGFAPPHVPDGTLPDALAHDAPGMPDTRGAVAIIGGLFAYLIITRFGGMVAGTFALVFISAMGDRTQTFQGAVVLAAVVTGAGLALFVWGLQMHLPLWPGSSF